MDAAGSWGCDMCTFVNTGEANVCTMCGKKRPDSSDIIPRVFRGKAAGKADSGDDTRRPDSSDIIPRVFKGKVAGKTDNVDNAKDNKAVKYNVKDEKVTVTDVAGQKHGDTNSKRIDAKASASNNKTKVNPTDKKEKVAAAGNKEKVVPTSNKDKVVPTNNKEKVVPTKVVPTSNKPKERVAPIGSKDKVVTTTSKASENRVKKPIAIRPQVVGTGANAAPKPPMKHKVDDTPEGIYEWVCAHCSVTNEDFFDSCKCCHKEKTNDVVYILDEGSEKRSKPSPTEETSKGKSDARKKEYVNKSKAEMQEWSCRRCTLKNSVSLTNCSVCETPRFCNIPSPESIPDSIDYSKFPPSARPPVSPGCSIVTPTTDNTDNSKTSKDTGPKATSNKQDNGKMDKNGKTAGGKPVVNNVKRSNGVRPAPAASGKAAAKTPPQKNMPDNKKVVDNKPKLMKHMSVWKCPRCTYHNPCDEQKCQMCYEDKNAKPQLKWVCSQCTFMNEPDHALCQMCNNAKGDIKNQAEEMEIDSPRSDKTRQGPNSPQPSTSKADPARAKPKTPLKTDLKPDSHCRWCTYANPHSTGSCKMCGQNLSEFEDDKLVSPGTLRPKHTLKRQQSSLMLDLRKEEDSEAIKLWQHITSFCKQVGN